MTEDQTDFEGMTKAQIIEYIQDAEDQIDDLVPNWKHRGEDPDELKDLKKKDLIRKATSYENTINKIRNAEINDPGNDFEAYGQKGLTPDQVEKLQHDKSL